VQHWDSAGFGLEPFPGWCQDSRTLPRRIIKETALSYRKRCAHALALSLSSLSLLACSASGDGGGSETQNNSTKGGSSASNGGSGPVLNPIAGGSSLGGLSSSGGTANGECGTVLPVTFRDFNAYGQPGGHEDFEASARGIKNQDGGVYQGWNDVGCGLVDATLGPDKKPRAFSGTPDVNDGIQLPGLVGRQQRQVDMGPGCWTPANPTPMGDCGIGICKKWSITPITYSIKSATTFDQWFNTVEGVNKEIVGELPLTLDATGYSTFDSKAFFPIDGQGFGTTAGQQHNYHFTTEIHVTFKYEAGQKFSFRGDDDLWIFVNNKLALDVGGQHQALFGEIDFDTQATALGITPGNSYSMDIFHAERQTSESNFRIQTNIKCFEPVVK
jgi:fibro-slime domain-containing protein